MHCRRVGVQWWVVTFYSGWYRREEIKGLGFFRPPTAEKQVLHVLDCPSVNWDIFILVYHVGSLQNQGIWTSGRRGNSPASWVSLPICRFWELREWDISSNSSITRWSGRWGLIWIELNNRRIVYELHIP